MSHSTNCPILEQTADGVNVGRCCYHLPDGQTCPRHGNVAVEVAENISTGKCTLENRMRKRKNLPELGKSKESKS